MVYCVQKNVAARRLKADAAGRFSSRCTVEFLNSQISGPALRGLMLLAKYIVPVGPEHRSNRSNELCLLIYTKQPKTTLFGCLSSILGPSLRGLFFARRPENRREA